eukprot:NODE_671_length_4854_cov_0.553312.p2 type:complete len:347 gc:universal NODE_671_length_4854_cov_0.553312:2906-1866(-)
MKTRFKIDNPLNYTKLKSGKGRVLKTFSKRGKMGVRQLPHPPPRYKFDHSVKLDPIMEEGIENSSANFSALKEKARETKAILIKNQELRDVQEKEKLNIKKPPVVSTKINKMANPFSVAPVGKRKKSLLLAQKLNSSLQKKKLESSSTLFKSDKISEIVVEMENDLHFSKICKPIKDITNVSQKRELNNDLFDKSIFSMKSEFLNSNPTSAPTSEQIEIIADANCESKNFVSLLSSSDSEIKASSPLNLKCKDSNKSILPHSNVLEANLLKLELNKKGKVNRNRVSKKDKMNLRSSKITLKSRCGVAYKKWKNDIIMAAVPLYNFTDDQGQNQFKELEDFLMIKTK